MITTKHLFKGKWFIIIFLLSGLFLSSCTHSDYVVTIPSNCSALVSIDMKNADGIDGQSLLKKIFGVNDAEQSGINFENRLYVYETTDGNIGLCADVADADKLDAMLQSLAGKNGNGTMKTRNGMHFVLIKNWLAAYTDDVLHIVGPITAEKRSETERFLTRVLQQDEDRSIVSTAMYARIDSMQAPMCFVGQAQALPEKLAAPFTIGAPKEADASQIMIAARMHLKKSMLHIEGITYSDNSSVNRSIQQSLSTFRPISGNLIKAFNATHTAGLFMNVSGSTFLPILQQNRSIQALLAGLNTAIDMNKILQSVNGDLALSFTSTGQGPVMLTAKLGNSRWLSDVDYWKQSCPQGTSITNQGTHLYCYAGQGNNFYFGVSPNQYFISGPTLSQCIQSIKPAPHPLPAYVASTLSGKRLAMLFNMKAMAQSGVPYVADILASALPGTQYIVYTLL